MARREMSEVQTSRGAPPSAGAVSGEHGRGQGLRVRLRRVEGITARGVLTSPLMLPCVIGDFTFSEEFGWTDYLTPDGEFSQPAPGDKFSRQLRTLDLESLTIDWPAEWLPGGWTDPHAARVALQDWGRSRTPAELLATFRLDRREELRMMVTLRGMDRTIRPGEGGTRYLPLRLREWRDNRLERLGRGGSSKRPSTVRIDANDTLRSIADRFDVSWQEVAAVNGITRWPPSKPLVQSSRLKVGDVLKVPPADLQISAAAEFARAGG